MNKYVKQFLYRGLIFGAGGPIVAGIVFLILGVTLDNFSLTGSQIFLTIISTYLLAFVHAGASVFNQVEHWTVLRSLFFHFMSLYVAYVACYTVNSWIPFEWIAILIFTAAFTVTYFIIWGTVVLAIKATERKLNRRLKDKK